MAVGQPVGSSRQLFREVPDLLTILSGRSIGTLAEALQTVGLLWIAAGSANPGWGAAIAGLSIVAPAVLFGPLAGPIADRYDRRRVLIASDAASAALAPMVVVGYLAGGITLAAVIASLAWTARNLATSAFTATFPDVVGHRRLVNANGLNVSLTNGTLMVGTLAGGLLAGVSPLLPFVVGGVLFVLAAIGWWRLPSGRMPTAAPGTRPDGYRQALAFGYRFARASAGVRWLVAVGVIATIGFAPSAAALPVLVRQEIGGGAFEYAVVLASITIGLVAGGLLTGRYGWRIDRPVLLGGGLLLMAVATAALGVATAVWLAAVVALARGAANSAVITANISLAQELVPSQVRGRVMAFRTAVQEAPRLLVLPLAGALIEASGARVALVAMAFAIALAGLVALGRRDVLRADSPLPAPI